MQPQPGTLSYIITKTVPVDIDHHRVFIIITDGTTARTNDQKARIDANLSNIPHAILVQLWEPGQTVDMKHWQRAVQQRDQTIMTDTVDEILRVLASSATPPVSAVFTAAQNVLVNAEKLDDWSKLNTLLQSMTETQLRQFLAFIILIILSKSAGE